MKAAAAKLESPIRVLLVDDHRLFAEALEAILAGEQPWRSSAARATVRRQSS